jgi:hypothetical protein
LGVTVHGETVFRTRNFLDIGAVRLSLAQVNRRP